MKILVNPATYSEKFIALTNALFACKGLNLGQVSGEVDDESLVGYQPDIVIHNNPELTKRLLGRNTIQLLIYDGEPITGVPTINLKTIGPCLDVHLLKEIAPKPHFRSDITFIGDIRVFDEELLHYNNGKYKLKIFNPKPVNLPYYCGMIPRNTHPSAYRSAKVCPFSLKEDESRLYEIVAAGGRAVIYDPEYKESFHIKIEKALSDDSFVDKVISKNDIDAALNVNKFPKLLQSVGFKKLGEAVLRGSL